jgi:tetratricopeptide (TPR) repeat protein
VIAIAAAGFIGYSQYAKREAAARHELFVKRASEGNALVAQAKFEAAIPALKNALESAPGSMTAERLTVYNNLAGAYIATGKTDEAQRILEDARRQTDALPETVLKQPEFRRERVRLLTGIANALLAQGKLAEAEPLYRRSVTLGPEDAAAHSNLANVLFLQEKFAEADAHFDQAVARQPDNPETLCNWGIMLLNYKHPREAEDRLRKAIAMDKKNAKYYHVLGLALRAQGRFGPALAAQQTALHYDAKLPGAYLEIADIYNHLGDTRKAEDYLRVALSPNVDPKNVQGMQALGRLLMGSPDLTQRNYLEAAELFQQLVRLTGEQDVNLLTQLADAYALAELYEQAGRTIELAIKRAREQKLSAVDIEVLLQHAQHYGILERAPKAGDERPEPVATEFTTAGDPLGMNPRPADPFDAPSPPPKSFSPTNLVAPP